MGCKVFYSHGSEHARGVLLAFKRTLDFQVESTCTDEEGRYIIVHAKIQGEPITFANVYLEPSLSVATIANHLSTITEKIAQGGNSRVVVCGDFNTVLDPVLDSCNRNRVDIYRQDLLSFMENLELTDVWRTFHPQERRYTSFSFSPNRIDFILASPAFLTHILNSKIGTSFASDHAPVYTEFTFQANTSGKGFWRLPKYLLAHPTYIRRIENCIDDIVKLNSHTDPAFLWDTLKTAIQGESIRFLSECKKDKQIRTAHLEFKIAQCTRERYVCYY